MIKAFILLKTDCPNIFDCAEKAKQVPGIVRSIPLYGEGDIMIEMMVKDLRQLKVRSKLLRVNPLVKNTQTFICMDEVKE
jgi:DNA-binding Lrp family transcriptional regulator